MLPYWRDWRLRDISRIDIQQWVAERVRKKQGWQTVRNAWVLLSGILETAVEYGYLSTNPARGVKFPQKELKEAPAIIAGPAFAKTAQITSLNSDRRFTPRNRTLYDVSSQRCASSCFVAGPRVAHS